MKKIFFIITVITIIFIFGCAAQRAAYRFEHPTNMALTESLIYENAMKALTLPYLPHDKKIVIMNMEFPEVPDRILNEHIEDQLINVLSRAGYTVLERDRDILVHLAYQEQSNRLNNMIVMDNPYNDRRILMQRKSEFQAYQTDTDIMRSRRTLTPFSVSGEMGEDEFKTSEVSYNDKRVNLLDLTKHGGALDAADIVIAYRVRNIGVKYVNVTLLIEQHKHQGGFVEGFEGDFFRRDAVADIHLRVIDTKSGSILGAANLRSSYSDTLPEVALSYIESEEYQYISPNLPNLKYTPRSRAVKRYYTTYDMDPVYTDGSSSGYMLNPTSVTPPPIMAPVSYTPTQQQKTKKWYHFFR